MKIQIQFFVLIFSLLVGVVQAQDLQPISEQNKAWFNPALISTNNGVTLNSQAGFNYGSYVNSNIQYFNEKSKFGITVLGNYINSAAAQIGQLKASVAKGFRFKGIDVTAAAGVERFQNHFINPVLRFNTGFNLKIKQLEIGYAFISSTPNGSLIEGHEPVFINNYIPSLHSFSTSYSCNIKQWSLQPSIYYSRIANLTQLQLQAIAVYKSKWVLGLSSSQFDP